MNQAADGEAAAVLAAVDLDPTLATRADGEGTTLLHRACVRNRVELASALLDRGSDVLGRDADGWDALLCATVRSSHNLALVTLLLDRGADPCSADNRGYTVLMDSAIHSDHQVCLLLVHRGADLLAAKEGQTALDLYGFDTNLAAAEKEERCAALRAAFAEGPHPSQVQRRKEIAAEQSGAE